MFWCPPVPPPPPRNPGGHVPPVPPGSDAYVTCTVHGYHMAHTAQSLSLSIGISCINHANFLKANKNTKHSITLYLQAMNF